MNRIIYTLSGLLIWCLPAKAQWHAIDSVTNANYMNVHFHDANNGIVSGEMGGRFFKTNNAGQTWSTVQVPYIDATTDYLLDMQFVNKDIGFVCGGSVFSTIYSILMRTTDGGQTWDSIAVNVPSVYEFRGVDFKLSGNGLKGIVFSSSFLLRSVDSGKNLVIVNKPLLNYNITDAVYIGGSTVLLAGKNYTNNMTEIYKSYNWGTTWNLVHTDTLDVSSLAVSGANGFITSWGGRIMKTTDTGNTWATVKITGSNIDFNKAKFGANGYPYLLGIDQVNGGGYVYGSDNNGQTWHSVLVDNSTWLTDISMTQGGTGYVVTNRKLYKTTNGGGLGLQVGNVQAATQNIKLYPNPVNGWLNIEVPSPAKIKTMTMYDAAGRSAGKWDGQQQRINVAGFAKGTYYMQVETSDAVFTQKLLLE